MVKRERIYRRTAAGQKAWDSQDPAVPAKYLRILGFIQTETHFDMLRARLPLYPDTLIAEGVAELEELGLLEPLPDTGEHDLDFTSSFNVSDLLGKQQ